MREKKNPDLGAASAAPGQPQRVEQKPLDLPADEGGAAAARPPVRQRRRPTEPAIPTPEPPPAGASAGRRRPSSLNDPDGPKRQPTSGYHVGYARPPERTRFKRGQSGNPKGRPKGSKNAASVFEKEMNSKIRVTENGQRVTITKLEAFLKGLINDGIKGDARARAEVLRLTILFSSDTSTPAANHNTNDNTEAPEALPPDAKPMLAHLERMILEKAGLSSDRSKEPAGCGDGRGRQPCRSAAERPRVADEEEGSS